MLEILYLKFATNTLEIKHCNCIGITSPCDAVVFRNLTPCSLVSDTTAVQHLPGTSSSDVRQKSEVQIFPLRESLKFRSKPFP